VLFDRTGQAIYIFDAEKTRKPTCYGDCARAWPPVLTTGQPVAGDHQVDHASAGTPLTGSGTRSRVTHCLPGVM
jgi:predicted lipoprotein with Yx(FWY)xxD motif